mmetsp:Transcript_28970/g.49382  ORF Transcript_28970/g.49382 Transcript_28970/m.49382 type:complete len:276 (-) Transcript_28970:359-1186(-)
MRPQPMGQGGQRRRRRPRGVGGRDGGSARQTRASVQPVERSAARELRQPRPERQVDRVQYPGGSARDDVCRLQLASDGLRGARAGQVHGRHTHFRGAQLSSAGALFPGHLRKPRLCHPSGRGGYQNSGRRDPRRPSERRRDRFHRRAQDRFQDRRGADWHGGPLNCEAAGHVLRERGGALRPVHPGGALQGRLHHRGRSRWLVHQHPLGGTVRRAVPNGVCGVLQDGRRHVAVHGRRVPDWGPQQSAIGAARPVRNVPGGRAGASQSPMPEGAIL